MFNIEFKFKVPSETMQDAKNEVTNVEEVIRKIALDNTYRMDITSEERHHSVLKRDLNIEDLVTSVSDALDNQVVLLGDVLDRIHSNVFVYIDYKNSPNDIALNLCTILSLDRYESVLRYSQILDITVEDRWNGPEVRLTAIMPSADRVDLHKLKSTLNQP